MILEDTANVWERLKQTARSEIWIIGLSVAAAVVLVLSGIHTAAVLLFWLVWMIVLFNRSADPKPPVAAVAPSVVEETDLDMLATVFNALDTPILVIAPDETVLLQNQAAEKAFGTIPPNTDLSARVRSPGILDMVRETIVTGKVKPDRAFRTFSVRGRLYGAGSHRRRSASKPMDGSISCPTAIFRRRAASTGCALILLPMPAMS